MNVLELIEILNACAVHLEEDQTKTYESVFASDMMSDVLAYANHGTILVTGLCNPQVLRTAEMVDCPCIIFVRSKKPTEDMVNLARDGGIHILVTDLSMYNTCGILYSTGKLGGVKIV